VLSVLVAMLAYATAALVGGKEQILDAASRLGPVAWSIVLGLSLVNYGARFARWHWYLARLGHRVPTMRHILYYLAGFAFTTTPGKAGEAIRSIYLKAHGVPFADSVGALFAERLMDLLVMVALASFAALHFQEAHWPMLVMTLAVLGAFPLVRSIRVRRILERRFSRLRRLVLRQTGQRVLSLLEASSSLLHAHVFYGGLLIGLVGWGAEGFAFYLICTQLGIDISLSLAVGIYAFSMLVGALSFIPGGLGSAEVVMGLLLTLLGASGAEAVAATIICRLATLWFAVLLGLLSATGLEAGRWYTSRALS